MINRISTAEIGLAIIAKRFEAATPSVGFTPPYPTWPIQELAFAESRFFTPRRLLHRVDQHVAQCLRANEVRRAGAPRGRADTHGGHPDAAAGELDPDFQTARPALRPAGCARPTWTTRSTTPTEDRVMPVAAVGRPQRLIDELDDKAVQARPARRAQAGAARPAAPDPRRDAEDEVHWGFRAIASNHPRAGAQPGASGLHDVAGLDRAVPQRKLFLLRNPAWPTGPRTPETVQALSRRRAGADSAGQAEGPQGLRRAAGDAGRRARRICRSGWPAAARPEPSSSSRCSARSPAGPTPGSAAEPASVPSAAGPRPTVERRT